MVHVLITASFVNNNNNARIADLAPRPTASIDHNNCFYMWIVKSLKNEWMNEWNERMNEWSFTNERTNEGRNCAIDNLFSNLRNDYPVAVVMATDMVSYVTLKQSNKRCNTHTHNTRHVTKTNNSTTTLHEHLQSNYCIGLYNIISILLYISTYNLIIV